MYAIFCELMFKIYLRSRQWWLFLGQIRVVSSSGCILLCDDGLHTGKKRDALKVGRKCYSFSYATRAYKAKSCCKKYTVRPDTIWSFCRSWFQQVAKGHLGWRMKWFYFPKVLFARGAKWNEVGSLFDSGNLERASTKKGVQVALCLHFHLCFSFRKLSCEKVRFMFWFYGNVPGKFEVEYRAAYGMRSYGWLNK